MPQLTVDQAFDLAFQHHQAGRLGEAENLYRQILSHNPNHANSLHLLGVIAYQKKRYDIAADLIRRALALRPDYPQAHSNLGNVLRDSGQLDQAIAEFRQAITLSPNFAEAHSNLGNALRDKGQLDDAIAAFRQAIELNPKLAEAHSNLGHALRDKGQLDDAIAAYRTAIALRPGYAEAHSNLGNALAAKGRLDDAIAAYRAAIALRPDYAEAHSNLGNALRDKGQLDAAIASYQQSVALNPNLRETHNNLGNALRDKGRIDDAVAAFHQAIALSPDYAEAHSNLGNALNDMGRLDDAIAAYRHAIALSPDYADAYCNLGNTLKDNGQLEEAIAAYRQAIALKPDHAQAHSNRGNALRDKGQLDEAIAACRHAISLNPNFPEAHSNLGIALEDKGQLDEAIAAYRRAIALNPKLPVIHSNLASALQENGQLDEAIAAYHQAIGLKPGYADAHSGIIYALHLNPAANAQTIAEEHRRWNHEHAEPLRKFIQPHTNNRDPNRRLRIGYVSPDFRNHVVGYNLLPLFRNHDRHQFEITCYAHVPRPDPMTALFQQNADRWRDIALLSDDQVADQIRQDQIDILIDLALHTGHNRLLIFAREPAPVQVTFAGYPSSTGLTAIDYRLSDPWLDPVGADESIYSEQTIRLPNSFWCYDPLDCRDIPVNPLPALSSGSITFGCLNNLCKVNDDVLTLWCKVLQQVQNSRLLLLAPMGSYRQRTLECFGEKQIEQSRIEFIPRQSREAYLKTFHRIDLGLDTFPYNGHTTTLDSLWMGVPVIALIGSTPVARAGWCQLSNLGLGDLAAQTPDQFVQIAAALATDMPKLEQLRSTLRQKMEQSPLMDAPRFTKNIESAYRQMWRKWCET
jgi:predicted O-linked N-acetylglucosamine transferase (SPINDLY family)